MGSILFELFNKIFIPLGSRNVVVFRQYVIQAIEIKHFNPIRLEENEQTFWIKKKWNIRYDLWDWVGFH